jgi:hypothetical protein
VNTQNAKKIGECEVCPATDIEITVHYGNLWMCESCWSKELALQAERVKPENVQARIDKVNTPQTTPIDNILIKSQAIDNSIQVRPDVFNAETIAIVELKKAIDENPEITNKPYALAETLKERHGKFQSVIFEANEKIVEASNNQRAIQIYLNQLANSLRAEEREKLKIADINYKPQAPKTPTVKAIKTTGTKKKFDKVELRKYAAELGVAEFTLQAFVIQRGISVEDAAKLLKKTMDAAKAGL